MKKSKMKLWKFEWDCGRQGKVEGVFIASEEVVQTALGKRVYFGEILGKHSDIQGVLEAGEIACLTDNQTAIRVLQQYVGMTISGYNPLDYLEEEN